MRRLFLALAVCGALGATVISCSSKASSMSMTSALDEADRYIAQGYPRDALKLLASCEKKILSPMDAIGVYKRYAALNEGKAAERVLKNTLKKNAASPELNAVYAWFLKNSGRAQEALKRSKALRGTKYASLYSELYFSSLLESEESRPREFYLSPEMQALYLDAFNACGDNAWSRNAALCNLFKGEYGEAASAFPEEMQGASDAYFWAQVFYDAKKYGEAAECLLASQDFLKKKADALLDFPDAGRKVSQVEITSLLSDSYALMGEEKEAERVRSFLIAQLTLEPEGADGSEIGATDSLLGTMYLNSALYALQRNDERAAYNTLVFVTQKWPDFVPALIAYGNFAYNSSRRTMDDPLTKSLRDAGVVSTEMKRFDEMPRVSVSDALLRMKESIARTHNDRLYVAALELEDKIDSAADERARLGRMYRVLERNAISADLYPDEITQYAVNTLLRLDRYQEAKNLFKKFLEAKRGLGKERGFEEDLAQSLPKMPLWEIECAAYFAAREKNADLAKRLYEYAVYETGYSPANGGSEISPGVSTESAVNLAMIYSSAGNKDKALELYGRAQSRASDNYAKSEIMYRLACIYDSKMEGAAAVKALEYSLYLNPANGKSRLLLQKFRDAAKN